MKTVVLFLAMPAWLLATAYDMTLDEALRLQAAVTKLEISR